MTKKMRMSLAALAGAVLLASAGTAAAVTGQDTTAGSAKVTVQAAYTPHRCYLGDLSAGLHGYQAQAGNRGFILTLTNTSVRSCSLYGYPGLRLENAGHRALPTTTFWGGTYFDPDPGRSLIVLSPGETASADISYGVYGTRSNSVLATYLEVAPPNDYRHFAMRLPDAPALIWLHRVSATAMARHTPYYP